jgi:hypothetical protein
VDALGDSCGIDIKVRETILYIPTNLRVQVLSWLSPLVAQPRYRTTASNQVSR